jgi:hypothetical protein
MATGEFETSRTAADRSVTELLPPELVQLGKDAGMVISVFRLSTYHRKTKPPAIGREIARAVHGGFGQ